MGKTTHVRVHPRVTGAYIVLALHAGGFKYVKIIPHLQEVKYTDDLFSVFLFFIIHVFVNDNKIDPPTGLHKSQSSE